MRFRRSTVVIRVIRPIRAIRDHKRRSVSFAAPVLSASQIHRAHFMTLNGRNELTLRGIDRNTFPRLVR
jgi:hypothetical protein